MSTTPSCRAAPGYSLLVTRHYVLEEAMSDLTIDAILVTLFALALLLLASTVLR